MDMNTLSSVTSSVAASTSSAKTSTAKTNDTVNTAAATDTTASNGVVYEKGDSSTSVNTSYKKQNAALIAQLKADSDARVSQLKDIVTTMMQKQGLTFGLSEDDDSIWKFLADGNFTVDAAAKAQAQKDIAADGYWGVEQTSDRIVDFAKALSGGDKDKADEMISAFKKGFEAATKSWGKTLPDISHQTYDAVMKKFDDWKNEEE